MSTLNHNAICNQLQASSLDNFLCQAFVAHKKSINQLNYCGCEMNNDGWYGKVFYTKLHWKHYPGDIFCWSHVTILKSKNESNL